MLLSSLLPPLLAAAEAAIARDDSASAGYSPSKVKALGMGGGPLAAAQVGAKRESGSWSSRSTSILLASPLPSSFGLLPPPKLVLAAPRCCAEDRTRSPRRSSRGSSSSNRRRRSSSRPPPSPPPPPPPLPSSK